MGLFDNINFNTYKINKALINASRALAELKGFLRDIPNQDILINAITINESKDSSNIENIKTTYDSIYKVLVENNYIDDNAIKVVNYRKAIWYGYNFIKDNGFISTNMIINMGSIIEPYNTGIRKVPGTNIVNSKTNEVIYTPPQGEKEIRDLLKELEDFINDNNDNIDPLIKLCLIHYKFESIHPFYDGNGRTGRILNILYLVLTNMIDSPILYLSNYIDKYKDDYYRLLNEFNDNYEEYIIYMLNGIEETSKDIIIKVLKLECVIEDYKKDFMIKLPKIYSDELLNILFKEVYVKSSHLETTLGITRQTASMYLKSLNKEGLLGFEKVGRDSIYKNNILIDLLKEF